MVPVLVLLAALAIGVLIAVVLPAGDRTTRPAARPSTAAGVGHQDARHGEDLDFVRLRLDEHLRACVQHSDQFGALDLDLVDLNRDHYPESSGGASSSGSGSSTPTGAVESSTRQRPRIDTPRHGRWPGRT